jgi:xanthine dehydrogenase YagS FAD-binding subunit
LNPLYLPGRAPPDEGTFRAAAEAALEGARPGRYNGFKVELAKRTLVRALSLCASGEAAS